MNLPEFHRIPYQSNLISLLEEHPDPCWPGRLPSLNRQTHGLFPLAWCALLSENSLLNAVSAHPNTPEPVLLPHPWYLSQSDIPLILRNLTFYTLFTKLWTSLRQNVDKVQAIHKKNLTPQVSSTMFQLIHI